MDRELFTQYFNNHTTHQQEKELMEWVNASPENQTTFQFESRLYDAHLVNQISVSKSINTTTKRRKLTNQTLKVVAVVASLALFFSLGYNAEQIIQNTDTWHSVIVPIGQRVELVLEDGTQVWLNSGSMMKYPSSFSKNNRRVILNGEGYFNVVRNEKAPFSVETKNYDIEVLGTEFNIYAFDNSEKFNASLLEGSIKISSNKNSECYRILKPNEWAREINGKLVVSTIKNYDRFRWRDGIICLDNTNFDSLMDMFENFYGVSIIINNLNTTNYNCTGKFRQSDGIEHALRVLQKDISFRYRRVEGSNVIYIE